MWNANEKQNRTHTVRISTFAEWKEKDLQSVASEREKDVRINTIKNPLNFHCELCVIYTINRSNNLDFRSNGRNAEKYKKFETLTPMHSTRHRILEESWNILHRRGIEGDGAMVYI